jgi:VWFA-related protein
MRDASAILLALVALAWQTPAPQFKSGVDLVRFDVVVFDKARHPIAGLTADDFHVTEDGKPLRIAGFQAVTIPDATTPPTALAPAHADPTRETVTNHVDGPGRLVVVFMDASIPNGTPIVTARRIANGAIDAMGPNDLGAVVFDSGISGFQQQDLTKDRERLRSAVASAWMGATSDLSSAACLCGACWIDKLQRVVEALASVQDYRKIILVIAHALPPSDGPGRSVECRGRYRSIYDRLLHEIDRGSVTIHVFDPNGLETGAVGADARSNIPHETAEGRMNREGDLAALPEYSGGRVVFDTNEQERLVPAIFGESRTYYVLAVERAPARKDGSAHRVKIAVSRPDATVASRGSYFDPSPADRAKSSDPLAAALGGLLPSADVPLRMTLAPGTAKGSSLDVTLATPLPKPARADVLVGVFDQFAKEVGSERARVDLPARDGVDAEWTLHLNPKAGRYEVRAAVRIGDRVGSITGHVEVTRETAAHVESKAAASATVPRSAALDAILAHAGGYVEQYGDPRGGLLLDETYRQQAASTPVIRTLKSELLILPDETEGWVQFRDVLAVDGKAVTDRADRLARLFSAPAADPRGQARRIAEEGARYNLTGASVVVKRSLNQPLAALLYLRSINQARSQFTLDGSAGKDGQHLTFSEQHQPTIIGTTGDGGATGEFWIDPATGLVRRAVLRVVSRASNVTLTAWIRVQYQTDAKTGLALPVTMEERYEARNPAGYFLDRIDGQAWYSNPRQFKVTVDKVE